MLYIARLRQEAAKTRVQRNEAREEAAALRAELAIVKLKAQGSLKGLPAPTTHVAGQ
ncbi:hypothetical protein [Mycolicibacter terrae]|uniref:hypothetical protein n=1 Tax=Mycolicibacter terrae TaxID=1788 RepID=UPI00163B1649|nr:hypothetical protein [Mycolicibacter terrae]